MQSQEKVVWKRASVRDAGGGEMKDVCRAFSSYSTFVGRSVGLAQKIVMMILKYFNN